jgi:hypothetical protein
MAYTPPTPDDLRARFPRFAAMVDGHHVVTDATLQAALDRAARRVDETWMEGDFAEARMQYAAHDLTLDGFGTGTEAQLLAEGVDDFQKIKLGSLQLERFDRSKSTSSGSAAVDLLSSTSFGRRFLDLLAHNKSGVVVAAEAPQGLNHLARDFPGSGPLWRP